MKVKVLIFQPGLFSERNLRLSDMLDVAEITREVKPKLIDVNVPDDVGENLPEAIFWELNVSRDKYPIDYSMSTNDIIAILWDNKWHVWHCKEVGWKFIGKVPVGR